MESASSDHAKLATLASTPSHGGAPTPAGVAPQALVESPPAWWLVVLYPLLVLPVRIGAMIFSPRSWEPGFLLGGTAAYQVALLFPALAWARLSGLRMLPLLRLTRPPRGALLLGVGTGLATALAGYGLIALLARFRAISVPVRSGAYANLATAEVAPWLFILVIAILPALCEEILFRGTLQTALLRDLSPARAITIVAVIFAAWHLDLFRFPGMLLASLAMGWLAWRTGSLWPGVVAHAVNNLGAEPVVASFGRAWRAAAGRTDTNAVAIGATALATGLLLLALLALAARRWLPPAPEPSSFLVRRGSTLRRSETG